MADTIAVANKFLEIAAEKRNALTAQQLLKLVYLAHGWCLSLNRWPLLQESAQAWQYGPIVPSLYEKVKVFLDKPVNGPLETKHQVSEEDVHVIRAVYNAYGLFSGVELSSLTNQPGSPWSKAKELSGHNAVISNDLIQHYYDRVLQKRADDMGKRKMNFN